MLNPSTAIGSVSALVFAGAMAVLALVPFSSSTPRSLDVTSYRVVGQGCGDEHQRTRIYVAMEEDDLPGPACDIVFELVERDYK